MTYLLDTSILARIANRSDLHYAIATHAVFELHRRGEILVITPQVLIEFRGVATRPSSVNGLGLSPHEAEVKARAFEAAFQLLDETADIYPAWKNLVQALGIIGKQVHDARLMAVCQVNRISHLLTFNTSHFARMANNIQNVTIVDPADI